MNTMMTCSGADEFTPCRFNPDAEVGGGARSVQFQNPKVGAIDRYKNPPSGGRLRVGTEPALKSVHASPSGSPDPYDFTAL